MFFDGESNLKHSLRKDLDGAAAKSLVAITTYSLVTDHDTAVATTVTAWYIITHQQLRPSSGDFYRP